MLPFHHRDPFGRLLLAQAKAEGMTLVTNDGQFGPYGVPLLWWWKITMLQADVLSGRLQQVEPEKPQPVKHLCK
jgi:hypothetical protein